MGGRGLACQCGPARGRSLEERASVSFPFAELPPLHAVLDAQTLTPKQCSSGLGLVVPFVFHREGQPIRGFRLQAGVRRRLFHDLRRTSVQNLVRLGYLTEWR